jgi:hypothetical protein
MTLTEQIAAARRQVVADGYDMSIGEVMSLYREKEVVINPAYQRLFRWEISQKTKFIESLLLGIPIPPIFVFQRKTGVWELIDGLQRLSTVFEFTGILRDANGNAIPPSELDGTNLLPGLARMRWDARTDGDTQCFDSSQQLQVKRARIRVEILKQESDEEAKFELFQRLNTGGSTLSPQEVRNCVMVMMNAPFYEWLSTLTQLDAFGSTIPLTETARNEQRQMELALRFIAYRRDPYRSGLDVNEYLDDAVRRLASMSPDDRTAEQSTFERTFGLLNGAFGSDAFKRWDGVRHTGAFLISGFDAIAHGVASNIDAIMQQDATVRTDWLRDRVRQLWSEDAFRSNSGMGVRGTTRLANLLPFGVTWFQP